MALVDATDDHHSHENLKIVNMPRIPREQRLQGKRPVRLDDDVNP